MTQPPRMTMAVRIAAGIVSAAAILVWAYCAVIVAGSLLTTDPAHDPHGYRLIFGSTLALGSGLVTAAALPHAFPVGLRRPVTRVTWTMFGLCFVMLAVGLCAV